MTEYDHRAPQKHELEVWINRADMYEFYLWADDHKVSVRAGRFDHGREAYLVGVSSDNPRLLSLIKLTWGGN